MTNFLYGPRPINEFIEFHNTHHVNYCEAIIHPNGDVEYCIPSHQETLLRICNINKEEFAKRIFNCNEIMIELCNESKCIATWFNIYVNPNEVTEEQFESLCLLRNNNCIDKTLLLTKEAGYQSAKGVRKYYD